MFERDQGGEGDGERFQGGCAPRCESSAINADPRLAAKSPSAAGKKPAIPMQTDLKEAQASEPNKHSRAAMSTTFSTLAERRSDAKASLRRSRGSGPASSDPLRYRT